MKNVKKALVLALAVLMLFVLCACGGGDALKGTWTRTDSFAGEVVVNFDGKGGCKINWTVDGIELSDKGLYTLDEENGTGTIQLEAWSESQTFSYEVDDTTLMITDNYSIFGGGFTKK